jgi:hypothetical protein
MKTMNPLKNSIELLIKIISYVINYKLKFWVILYFISNIIDIIYLFKNIYDLL